jgi:hypothetical protein
VRGAAARVQAAGRLRKSRPGIRDRVRPLPSSRPLARSLCGHTTRSRLADGKLEKFHIQDFTVTEYAAQAVQIGTLERLLKERYMPLRS